MPKVKTLVGVIEFHPISLYNVLNQIASNTLASKLNLVLPNLISHNQRGFMLGRFIIHNVLVALEIFHTKKTKPKVGEGL